MNTVLSSPPIQEGQAFYFREELHYGLQVLHCKPEQVSCQHPIVFVHGFWSTAWMFRKLMEYLALFGIESYAITSRGRLNSKHTDDLGRVRIQDYMSDVENVIMSIGRPVVLAGHSAGALIAGQVVRLGLDIRGFIGMTAAPHMLGFMGISAALAIPKYLLGLLKRKPMSLTKNDARKLLFNTFTDDEFRNAYSMAVPESASAIWQVMLWRFAAPRIKGMPLFWIAAEKDEITPNQRGLAKSVGVPDDDYRIIKGACHMLMMGPAAEQTANVISSWLHRHRMLK